MCEKVFSRTNDLIHFGSDLFEGEKHHLTEERTEQIQSLTKTDEKKIGNSQREKIKIGWCMHITALPNDEART